MCHISAESFLDALHNHHREMKRFKLLAAARSVVASHHPFDGEAFSASLVIP